MSNELQQLPDMTLEEAQAKHAQLKSLESVMRSSLLEMRDRKGWKALGYSSFSEYGEQEWGFSQSYISRLTNAAAIQEKLNMPMGINDIPERTLRPLGKVPDADKSAVYEEAVERALAEGKKLGAKMMEDTVADYMEKNQTLQGQLENYQTMYSEASQQRDKLRKELTTSVESKVEERIAESRALLILENQQALAEAKRIAENAQGKLEQLRKDQAKAIKDGVFSEIQKRKTEIDQLEYRCESLQKQAEDLTQARDLLEKENGIVKQHLDSIGTIGESILDIKSALYLAEERGAIPVELINEWSELSYAISGLSKQFTTFCNQKSHVIDSSVLINGLTDLERTLESEMAHA